MHNLLELYSPNIIINVLSSFLTQERINRIEHVLSKRIVSVHVALEAPYDIHNAFAVVRSAEALGIPHIHFINAQLKKGQGRSTTRGTLKWAHLKRHNTIEEFMKKNENQLIVGASIHGKYLLDELPIDRPICFLFGNECKGLTETAHRSCDLLFRVPMYGMVESYNLSVSAAISLYDYLKRKRIHTKKNGDLSDEEYLEEKARFYIRSLGIDAARAILLRKKY